MTYCPKHPDYIGMGFPPATYLHPYGCPSCWDIHTRVAAERYEVFRKPRPAAETPQPSLDATPPESRPELEAS
jgi:hypothetical protein